MGLLVAWWCLLAAVVVALAVAARVTLSPRIDSWMAQVQLPTQEAGPSTSPAGSISHPPGTGGGGGSLGTVLALCLLVGLVLVGVSLVARWWRSRPHPLDPAAQYQGTAVAVAMAPPHQPVERAARLALARLDAATNPSDAVVAAWLTLEEEAAAWGVIRHPAQTPTEFTRELLHDSGCDPRGVGTVLNAYHRVRFGHHTATPEDVQGVRVALDRIAASLRGYA